MGYIYSNPWADVGNTANTLGGVMARHYTAMAQQQQQQQALALQAWQAEQEMGFRERQLTQQGETLGFNRGEAAKEALWRHEQNVADEAWKEEQRRMGQQTQRQNRRYNRQRLNLLQQQGQAKLLPKAQPVLSPNDLLTAFVKLSESGVALPLGMQEKVGALFGSAPSNGANLGSGLPWYLGGMSGQTPPLVQPPLRLPDAPTLGGQQPQAARLKVVGPNGERGTIQQGDALPPGWQVIQ